MSGKRIVKLNNRYRNRKDALLSRVAENLLIDNAKANFLQMDQAGLKQARNGYQRALQAMVGSDIEGLHERATRIEQQIAALGAMESAEEVSQIIEASQLNWEVLPPGELEEAAREMIEGIQGEQHDGKTISIDLARLRALSNLREWWGEDRCYFARGKLGQRRVIKRDGAEQADQYLLLVMKDFDPSGNLIGEHIVAESPIARKHAMYVFRYDVSVQTHWRSAMALPKKLVQGLGARQVLHVLPADSTELAEAMTNKARALLSCTKEEFPVAKFDGARGLRIPRAILPAPPESEVPPDTDA